MSYLFSYPTTTLFLDDDDVFLSTLTTSIPNHYRYVSETDPTKALQRVINNQAKYKEAFTHYTTSDIEDIVADNDKILCETSIQQFINLSFAENRYQQITTIVLDYDMPGMDGLLFADSFDRQEISIVMLTGNAKHEMAINALNNGIIDKFILKDSPDLVHLLLRCIKDAQSHFFHQKTHTFLCYSKLYELLSDKEFSTLFSQIVSKYNIEEYYLLNSSASYLLHAANGIKYIFNFMPETELNYYRDIAKGNDAPQHIIDKLGSDYIPCLYGKNIDLTVNCWDPFLSKASTTKLKNSLFYYSVSLFEEDYLFKETIL